MAYFEEKKYYWLIAVVIALVLVVAFFVTSFVLADVHDVSVVTEWQTWFGIAKKVVETPPVEDVTETAKIIVLHPFKAMLAC